MADVLIKVPLPIIGRLEMAEVVPPPPSAFTRGLRLITRCCEAFTLGIVLTCLAACWLDPSLAGEFLRDPLGAFAATASRVL
jgi:hypothetical protein